MFTGIVEEIGQVISFKQTSRAWALHVEVKVVLQGTSLGDSIAVNGCCLTVTGMDERSLTFDVLEETRRLTQFSRLESKSQLNLERSLRFDGKVGGHFVTGHIDAQGEIEIMEKRGADTYLRVRGPAEVARLIVNKGSVALDGVSLTVVDVEKESFAVWLIPTTLSATNLGEKQVGDALNIEFDLLGKYVEKLTSRH